MISRLAIVAMKGLFGLKFSGLSSRSGSNSILAKTYKRLVMLSELQQKIARNHCTGQQRSLNLYETEKKLYKGEIVLVHWR